MIDGKTLNANIRQVPSFLVYRTLKLLLEYSSIIPSNPISDIPHTLKVSLDYSSIMSNNPISDVSVNKLFLLFLFKY